MDRRENGDLRIARSRVTRFCIADVTRMVVTVVVTDGAVNQSNVERRTRIAWPHEGMRPPKSGLAV